MTGAIANVERRASCDSVGGIELERLAARVGGTPFFAYDRRALTERIELLRSTLPPAIGLGYAIKANPMPAVVQHLSGLVVSFDVASAGEMRVALDTPMPPDRVSFAGPGKTPAELTQAVKPALLRVAQLQKELEKMRVQLAQAEADLAEHRNR